MKPHENPLVPNKRLREIYETMAEARTLDEFATRAAAKAKIRFHSTRGEEACRVSTAIGLGEGDLISDSHIGIVMNLISGNNASSLLQRLNGILSGEKRRQRKHPRASATLLPWTNDTAARLAMGLGAAAAIKSSGRSNLVIAYVNARELADADWQRVLRLAAELELPIIFVVLPGKGNRNLLCAKAQACGLPGFPVDASDAVAIYRVAQESIGRARGDGGPILIECLAHRAPAKSAVQNDPLAQLHSFLLSRKVANQAWLDGADRAFRRQLETNLSRSQSRKSRIQR